MAAEDWNLQEPEANMVEAALKQAVEATTNCDFRRIPYAIALMTAAYAAQGKAAELGEFLAGLGADLAAHCTCQAKRAMPVLNGSIPASESTQK